MIKGFEQKNGRAYFQFLKGNPGCPEDRELWRGKGGGQKVFQSWPSSAESFDGGPALMVAGKMERRQQI